MNQAYSTQDHPGQQPRQERTPAWVWLMIVAALCLVGGVVLVRYNEVEHNRQVQETVDEFIEESGG